MTDNRSVWEGVYRQRGKLWGGGVPVFAGIPDRSRVLELGCGNGKVLEDLRHRECTVVGLDFSRAALIAARSGLPESWPGEIVLADARELPFISGSFDAVIARHVIGHMTKTGRMDIAGEIHRVLSNDGILYFSGFSREDFRYTRGDTAEEGTRVRGNGISTHYFTLDETRTLFSGFSCESIHESRWTLRIRGKDYERSEIIALFRKSGNG